jgi:hypothetical protein
VGGCLRRRRSCGGGRCARLAQGTPERQSLRPGAQVVRTPHVVRLTPERRQEKSPKVVASPDFTPFAETRGKSQLSANWLLVPAGILALIVLVPASLGIAHLRRSRRAWRAYQAR